MELRRLDDYQSWQISHEGSAVLIDPWLTDEPVTGSFRRLRGPDVFDVDAFARQGLRLEAIALCTSVNDHTRPATLRALAAQWPTTQVIGSRSAVRIARRAGLPNGRVVRPGDEQAWVTAEHGCIRLTVTRTGLPLGLIAMGYLIEGFDRDGVARGRIWIEPHQPTQRVAAAIAPVDVALLPTQSVTAVVMPVTAGPKVAAKAAWSANARLVVPTATDPRRDMTAWQRTAYLVRGGAEDLRTSLAGVRETGPTLLTMAAGDTHTVTHADEQRPHRPARHRPGGGGRR